MATFPSSMVEPQVVAELDVEAIYDEEVADFLARWAARRVTTPSLPEITVLNLETDPLAVGFQANAAREVKVRAAINDAARANLLWYATAADLDHVGLGAQPPVERMEAETDDRYRRRIWLAAQAQNAGSRERYEFVALSADLTVADAIAYRVGRDPTVYVALMSTDAGGIATEELINVVQSAFAEKQNLLVNGDVVVRSAVSEVIPIIAQIKLTPSTPSSVTASIITTLKAAWATEGGLGRDLTLDWIKARMQLAGVYSVQIISPIADRVVPPYEAVSIGEVTITISGRDE